MACDWVSGRWNTSLTARYSAKSNKLVGQSFYLAVVHHPNNCLRLFSLIRWINWGITTDLEYMMSTMHESRAVRRARQLERYPFHGKVLDLAIADKTQVELFAAVGRT